MARKALGKGLGALMPGSVTGLDKFGKTEISTEKTGSLDLPIGDIKPNPYQPRLIFKAEELQSLAESISKQGVLQPILVRKTEDGYELIAGERRLRAAKSLGYQKIPAVVRVANKEQMIENAIVENVQRSDLSPLEEAQSYKRLMDEVGLTQEQVAQRIGKDRATVANLLRLLKLPKEVQALLDKGELTGGHAKALVSLASVDAQKALARRAAREGWSVRQIEEAAAASPTKINQKKKNADPGRVDTHISELQDRLRKALATKVKIKVGKKGGTIEVQYYSDEELVRIAEKITE